MAQEITARRDIPTPTPRLTRSISPQERTEHRQKIAFDVEVILDGYWKTMPPPQIKAGILADWCDTLEDWTQEQVLWALRKWRNENPDKRPNPGHILAICKKQRGMKLAREMRDTPPQEPKDAELKLTAEDKARIAAELGLPVITPKRITE